MGFIKHICKDAIDYEKYQVMETDLSEHIEIKDAKIPVNIRTLTSSEDDISKIVAFWPDVYSPRFSTPESLKEMIIKRLAAGEVCNIAEYEGKIIHMGWQGFQNTHLWNPYVRKRGLKSDELLSYNVFCSPEYRGNNIPRAVGSRSYPRLIEKGYRKVIGYTQPNNIASISSAQSLASKPVQTLHWLNILGWNIYHLTKKKE